MRKYLIDNIDANGNFGTNSKRATVDNESSDLSSGSEEDEEGNRKMRLRRRDTIDYDTIDDDDEYFQRLGGRDKSSSKKRAAVRGRMKKAKTDAQLGREFAVKEAGP